MRGKGIRNKSCCIEPIDIAGALTAKHCGDSTSDCSNGVLIYPAKVVKPYGSTGGIGGVKLKENEKDIASPITARDYKGILRNDGDAIVEIRAVLTQDREEKRQNGRRMKDEGEPMFTPTAQDRHGVAIAYDEQNNTLCTDGTDKALKVIDVYNKRELKGGIVGTLTASGNTSIGHCGTFLVAEHNDADIYTGGTVGTLTTDGSSPKHNNRVIVGGSSVRIRRLTPRECWRLQGFPDEYFDKAKAAGISDSQLYKMAGNAVTVNVARAIGERLKEIEDEET